MHNRSSKALRFLIPASCVALVSACLSGGWPARLSAEQTPSSEKQSILTLQAACKTLANSLGTAPAGRLQDLELYLLAVIFDQLGNAAEADLYRQYLRDYYEKSPLVGLLPPPAEEAGFLSDFNPHPNYSRLVKVMYQELLQPAQTNEQLQALDRLITLQVEEEFTPHPQETLETFLQTYPLSPYAGWAAYQLVWDKALGEGHSLEPLRQFAQEHPDHPLGQEAGQASQLKYFSAQNLAQRSSVIPGWGEGTLEPGLRESSSFMYSEILYLLSALGFTVVAQYHSRLENLTGALIAINLLLLNHHTSAENAYLLAQRRNLAAAKKFLLDHLDRPVLGQGRFSVPHFSPPPPDSLDQELILSVSYPLVTAAEGFRSQNLIQARELMNLGLRAEYVASVFDFWRNDDWAAALGIAPLGRLFVNHARPETLDNAWTSGLDIWEAAGGVEGALLIRFDLGGAWIQVRGSAGPAFRSRKLSVATDQYQDQNWVMSSTVSLDLGGLSGSYWHLALMADDSFQNHQAQFQGVAIDIPSRSLAIQFGLGIRF